MKALKEDSKADKAADVKAGIRENSKADIGVKAPMKPKKRKILGKY